MKVALVYDRVNKWGGAERVMLALHEMFPDAPLYTSVYHKEKARWAKSFLVIPSFLQNFPFAKDAHEFYPLLMPSAFESFNFDDYDVVISVTSESAKGIITRPSTLHICYCLTPTRYLWSGYKEYLQNKLMQILSYPAISYLKTWDKVAASRPDVYVSISSEIKDRVKRYYNKDSEVIFPPVVLFETTQPKRKITSGSDYYLVVSRLVTYKRIDLAIKACNKLKLPLKIVGEGSQLEQLKKIAGPTVEFMGAITDEELIPLYRNCKAFLFPGYEDFGIVMVEAMGFGKPVIAYNKGGARDIILHKRTGILFDSQTVTSLVAAIEESQKITFSKRSLHTRAKLFSQKRFKDELNAFIAKSLQIRKITL